MSENTPPTAPLRSFESSRDEIVRAAQWRHDVWRSGRIPGPVTGFPGIDKYLGYYLRPGLHVLHGGPGAGKSALALTFARQCQSAALYYTTELPDEEIRLRLAAQVTGVPCWKLERMDGIEYGEHYDAARKDCPRLGVMDATADAPSLADLRHGIVTLLARFGKETVAHGMLAVVDSVHTFAMRAYPEMLERDRIDFALTNLETLAKTLRVPIICVAERNRSSRDDSGQTAAKGSGKFEYAAESVLGLDVDKNDESGDAATNCILTVSKTRKGRAGKGIGLRFEGETMRHFVVTDPSELEGTGF